MHKLVRCYFGAESLILFIIISVVLCLFGVNFSNSEAFRGLINQ